MNFSAAFRWLLMFASVLAAAQTPALKPSANCVVEGQIVQQPGGEPIRKAGVTLRGTARDQDNQSAPEYTLSPIRKAISKSRT